MTKSLDMDEQQLAEQSKLADQKISYLEKQIEILEKKKHLEKLQDPLSLDIG